jgi:hypothetical protein
MKRWMVLCLLACACGSDSGNNNPPPATGSGTVTGTVGGKSLTVKDAVFGIDVATGTMTLVVADRTDICTLLGGNTLPSGETHVLGIGILNWVGGLKGGDIVTGDYTWLDLPHLSGPPANGKYWNGVFAIPTSCTSATTTDSTAGSLAVTQVGTTTGTHLKVTFTSLQFGADTLTGNVEALYCSNATLHPNCGATLLARPPSAE